MFGRRWGKVRRPVSDDRDRRSPFACRVGALLRALACLGLMSAAGCQCCPDLRDCSSGVVDHVVDHSPKFDALYVAGFDLTRIGHPDWCECPANRLTCCDACDEPRCED